ncbi:TIGR03943 family protein [Streptomyces sp. LX-29]|uniref:TIGR03943 family putative permease subunit n=1 Tax=Streptomyces sp. LX-29 TaxID=2900152 RepID=UPI00240D147D|nr:TIGR03943 family protein [Streptomyces sp. LX-29]WFB10811.1 TIGR03943 family protein [Streptomyces sp. LX-29]
MRRQFQILLLGMAGAAVLRISLFGDLYLRYVKEGLRLPLIATGCLLFLLALVGAWRDGFPFPYERPAAEAGEDPEDGPHTPGREHRHGNESPHGNESRHEGESRHRNESQHEHESRPEHQSRPEHESGHGHDHARGPRVGWLLFLPVVGLMFAAPPPLAAYTAERQRPMAVEEESQFAPLPARSPVPMSLLDFSARAVWDTDRSLSGRTVRLTGFVTPGKDGGPWYLTRMRVSCCAADAQALKVAMYGGEPPAAGTWLVVTGRWHPRGRLGTDAATAALDVRGLRTVPEPANPYRDDAPQ